MFLLLPYLKNIDKYLYGATLTLGILYIFIMEPVELYINRAAQFVQQLEQTRTQDNADLAFYKVYRDGLAIKYMVQVDSTLEDQTLSPHFFKDWTRVENSNMPLWVIIESEVWEKDLSPLQKDVCKQVIQGKIGRANIIACKITPVKNLPSDLGVNPGSNPK